MKFIRRFLSIWIVMQGAGMCAPVAMPPSLRGNNDIVADTSHSRTILYPQLFLSQSTGNFNPDIYTSATTIADLQAMKAVGYDCVRTFIESRWNAPGLAGSGRRLNAQYAANVVDFVKRARADGMFAILSFGFLSPSYYEMVDEVCRPGSEIYDPSYKRVAVEIAGTSHTVAACPFAEGFNQLFAHKGIVRAQAQYVMDMLDEIKAADPTLIADRAFAIEIMNEPYLVSDRLPFSITTGTLTVTLDQPKTYNMDIGASNGRQALADDMVRYWLGHTITPVKARYPDVPVIVSTFTPYTTGRSQATGFADANGSGYTGVMKYEWLPDERQPMRVSVIAESAADAISIHCSPVPIGAPYYDMAVDMRSAEIDRLVTDKRLIMGEFWAPRQYFPTIETAAGKLIDFQMQSVAYGFSGWLFWNWQASDWNALSANGSISNMLSPLFRPDPSRTRDIRLIQPLANATWRYGSYVETEWMSNVATAGLNFQLGLAFDDLQMIDLGAGQAPGGHGITLFRIPVTDTDINMFRVKSATRPDVIAECPIALAAQNGAHRWYLYQ